MNLYLLTQSKITTPPYCEECVVVAENRMQARRIHPLYPDVIYEENKYGVGIGKWVGIVGEEPPRYWPNVLDIELKWIGTASPEYTEPCVISSSYYTK
jgi:hypothetical protein